MKLAQELRVAEVEAAADEGVGLSCDLRNFLKIRSVRGAAKENRNLLIYPLWVQVIIGMRRSANYSS
jgi:hypothetical protein